VLLKVNNVRTDFVEGPAANRNSATTTSGRRRSVGKAVAGAMVMWIVSETHLCRRPTDSSASGFWWTTNTLEWLETQEE